MNINDVKTHSELDYTFVRKWYTVFCCVYMHRLNVNVSRILYFVYNKTIIQTIV